MDFREATLWLMNNFDEHELSTPRLVSLADSLVRETSPPTAESIARKIFKADVHRDRKINFIKDIRAYGYDGYGMTIGLVDAKAAAERIITEYDQEQAHAGYIEDEDGSLAFARMLERKAEQSYDYNEEPF